VLGVVVFAAGCSGNRDVPEDGDDDIPAFNAKIEVAKADVPARYAAALPTSAAGLERWFQGDPQLPPFVHVKDLMLNGDARWLDKVAAAAKAVPAAESAAWIERWQNALSFEFANRGFCAPARAILDAPPSTLRQVLVGVYASSCASGADLALMVRSDTPDSAVLGYYRQLYNEPADGKKHPFHPRLAGAARNVILNDPGEARVAAFVLVAQPEPEARAALRRIHAEIRDQKHADEVALAFNWSKDPQDRALAEAACARKPDDPACDDDPVDQDDDVAMGIQVIGAESAPPPKPSAAAAGKLIDRLIAAGFTKVAAIDPAEVDVASADAVLLIAGHAYWFDVETGMYPNNHDSLMRQLAALVSPELDDTIFEEAAPGIEEAETEPYELTVYTAGKRLRAEARNLGDWYDVEAVLNLMNAVAKERGSNMRFVALASTDQTMTVVAAPAGAIARAIQGGLIEIGAAGEAEKAGKDFENKVMEALKD
jgi:hypothetical protein